MEYDVPILSLRGDGAGQRFSIECQVYLGHLSGGGAGVWVLLVRRSSEEDEGELEEAHRSSAAGAYAAENDSCVVQRAALVQVGHR